MKKLCALLVPAMLLFINAALAEVCTGTTVAGSEIAVPAESGGTVAAIHAEVGDVVERDALLAELRTHKVFAAEDGSVARILAEEGDEIDGAVLELAPVSEYTIHCSVDGAYSSADTTRVRVGETLYLRCTKDGSHRGTGVVTSIDGEEYLVAATGGEFYVGEVVRLYRDAGFSSELRTGVGTVVSADVQPYEAQGWLIKAHVSEGEYVQRGELLFEYADGKQTTLTAPAAGIVTEAVAAGDVLESSQTAFRLAPVDQIMVEVSVDELLAASLEPGETVTLIFADDRSETGITGTVVSSAYLAQDGLYSVRIRPEVPVSRLGMTVEVHTMPDDESL